MSHLNKKGPWWLFRVASVGFPEEVFNKLKGGKVFSKIGLNEAFLQIPVEENSSKILT